MSRKRQEKTDTFETSKYQNLPMYHFQKWLGFAIFCEFDTCHKQITIGSLFGSPCSSSKFCKAQLARMVSLLKKSYFAKRSKQRRHILYHSSVVHLKLIRTKTRMACLQCLESKRKDHSPLVFRINLFQVLSNLQT